MSPWLRCSGRSSPLSPSRYDALEEKRVQAQQGHMQEWKIHTTTVQFSVNMKPVP